jgi:ribonucleotide reductase beta subunit family protein with ferritin-like domain
VYGTDKDEFYLSYLDDPIFKDRAKWLGKTLHQEDKKLTCLVFGLVEGLSLFSMFALLRSFQANGINKIVTTVKGTKQSANDELLHSEYLATTFQYYYGELDSSLDLDVEYYDKLLEQTYNVFDMEKFILTEVIKTEGFPEDEFNGVKLTEYFDLLKVLANVYFIRLGSYKLPFPEIETCTLYDWFFTSTVAYAETDFFGKGEGKEYEHAWNEEAFVKCWLEG